MFILIAAVFIIGSLFDLHYFTLGANYLLVPILVLYYRYKARNWFIFLVLALFFFYLRDIFLIHGMSSFHPLALMSFLIGILILYGFAITGFPRSKVHFVEWLSLLIMYGFLGFLFYTMAELMAEVLTVFESRAYLFLFLLTLLLAITFTAYLLKSHYASLWLMLASASLLVSELSLFFKTYVVSDISVNVFYPLFHVITYYALVEHGLHRRRSSEVPYF
ncbi:hypothetical protein SAMN04488034_10279 [Salinimicrobium catena]|uniref:YhhN-like protein n=1 Tax=Salinimicrobium catena TaxID=390640 RepID=A0A1H5L1Q8_9FLAO|nr:hypothetical protein [Salinimicrobium catena]SDL04145.1 hypothetical protein SAMN04488140_10279 [Salinimicrobium catena]SEE70517.1 hypothetical protein SAMN04488034_10279 [Salinimicrobium catena]